jgi:hypothetical protein
MNLKHPSDATEHLRLKAVVLRWSYRGHIPFTDAEMTPSEWQMISAFSWLVTPLHYSILLEVRVRRLSVTKHMSLSAACHFFCRRAVG